MLASTNNCYISNAYMVIRGLMKFSHYGIVRVANIDFGLSDELTLLAIKEFSCTGVQNDEVSISGIDSSLEVPNEILTMSGEFTEEQSEIVDQIFFSNKSQNLTFFFEGEITDIENKSKIFREFVRENLSLEGVFELIENQEWRDSYKEYFTHAEIDKDLVVLPDWNANNDDFNSYSKKLLINPGMGFGTGGHETTRLCLKHLNSINLVGRALDLGCGSGILGNYCELFLGASVDYVDVDEDALENCRQNIELNNLNSSSNVYKRNEYSLRYSYDLVIANILKPVLEAESDIIFNALSIGGKILFSGILKSQYLDLINYYQEKFNVLFDYEILEDNGWVALLVTQKEKAIN